MVFCIGFVWLLRSARRRVQLAASIVAVGWFALFLMPGSVVATMVRSAVLLLPGEALRTWMMRSGVALYVGLLVGLGGLAVMAARWLVWSEPRPLEDLRRLHGDRWMAGGPRAWATALGAGLIMAMLALGEIPITLRLAAPAPSPTLSVTMLNAMHYQRPQTVIAILVLLVAAGLLLGLIVVGLSGIVRRGARLVPLVLVGIIVTGCCEVEPGVTPLQVSAVIGGPGRLPGRFNYPRAAAVDPVSGALFVVEKSGRVQRLSPSGEPEVSWEMPRIQRGRPTGISVGPDGLVWVADTHEHRVAIFTREGTWVRDFGGYGLEDGRFLYPTDVAFGPDGLVYVSEYGGNDRIQVFTREGQWKRTLGGPGPDPGQFERPQALAFSPDGTRLIVAEARNRRIQSVDPLTGEGVVLIQGDVTGALQVPFGLLVREDGSMLVSDTGSHSLLELDVAGGIVDRRGGWGWDPGRLRDPWAVIGDGDRTLVLDSGNGRLLVLP